MENGYPNSFVEPYSEVKKNIRHQTDQLKHIIYLKMQYRGESGIKLIRKCLSKPVKENCKDSQLKAIPTSHPLFTLQSRDRRSKETTSNVVHQFTCICRTQYSGRTERRLNEKTCKHLSDTFNHNLLRSSIA